MTKPAPPEKEHPTADRGPSGGRWFGWRGALKWGAIFVGLFLILLFLGGWLAYSKRTAILNAILEDATAPYTMIAGKFEFDARGNFELYDVRLEEDGETGVTISIPHVSGFIDFREALGGKVVSVNVESPEIRVPLETVMFSESPAGLEAIDEEVSMIAPEFTSPKFALESLQISDARVLIGGALTASFDYDADALSLYGDGSIETRRHHLSLRDVRFANDGSGGDVSVTNDWVSIPKVDAEFSIHREGGLLQVHSLEIPQGIINWDAAMLRWLVNAGFGPLFIPVEENETDSPSEEALASTEPEKSMPFSRLVVEKLKVDEIQFSVKEFDGLPDMEGTIHLEGAGVKAPLAGKVYAQELRVDGMSLGVEDVAMRLPESDDFARIPRASFSLTKGDDHIYEVRDLLVREGDYRIDPEVIDFFTDSREQATESLEQGSPSPSPSDAGPDTVIRIVSASLGSRLTVNGFADLRQGREFFIPDVVTEADVQLEEMLLSNSGEMPLRSTARQEIIFSKVQASLPGEPALANICGVQVALIPDEFMQSGQLLECLIDSPDVRLTEPFWALIDEMETMVSPDQEASQEVEAETKGDVADVEPWQQVHADTFEINDGFFEVVQTDTEIPNFSGYLEAHTQNSNEHEKPVYVVDATDLQFYAPADPSAAFATANSVQVIADADTLWKEKRVTSATLKGAELIAGKRFDTLLVDAENLASEPTDAASGSKETMVDDNDDASVTLNPRDDWHVGEFYVEDSIVVVKDLATLIPDIPLPIKATLADFPLTKEGFYAHEEPLKVEVAQLRIPSPYGQSRTPVAYFDSVFLHFTLGGLMRYEIDKVELLNPAIYIGENLFWYVEFFRKAEAEEEVAAALSDPATNLEPAAVSAARDDDEWNVAQIDAFYGQLIIALNGNINPDLPAFPFNCSTALNDGTLSAELEIPGGEYRPLEGVDLMVKVTGGKAEFNLPLGQTSNNLVQVFKAEELRYKQFLTTAVHLSVTYDQYGIYASFGGETYDGYTNGALNLYINDEFTWDAWVAGSKVSATEITRVLTPEYYLMSGAADFKVIAQGDLGALYQANGTFSMDAPGIISIPALDELKDEFPSDWTVLETSLAKVGVSALRDLPYETCEADFNIFEREGTLNLKAAGPSGLRSFQVAVHDYRIPAPVKILELAYSSDDAGAVETTR